MTVELRLAANICLLCLKYLNVISYKLWEYSWNLRDALVRILSLASAHQMRLFATLKVYIRFYFCYSRFESPTFEPTSPLTDVTTSSRAVCASPAIFPAGIHERNTLLEKRSFTNNYLLLNVVSRLFSSKPGDRGLRGVSFFSYRSVFLVLVRFSLQYKWALFPSCQSAGPPLLIYNGTLTIS